MKHEKRTRIRQKPNSARTLNSTDQGDQLPAGGKLPHPFAFGSCVSVFFGVITLYLESQNLSSFQSPLMAAIAPILIFGYFPITMIFSPVVMAIASSAKYGNTKGLWWYFGGSALFGFLFSVLIYGLLFIGFILSGPP